jgi:molybdate transport system ATP-binding protein
VVLSGFYDTPLLYQGATPDQEAAADELIDYLGIRQLTESSMGALSTGQMRKILIARALVCSPDVLLLDASLDGLDVASREEVLKVIDKAAERSTLVFAAHRVGDVPLSIGRTVIMDGGVIIAEGDRANALELLQDNAPEIVACEVPALPVAADFDFLLRMENVSVVSDGTQIMYDIDWTIRSGDQWIVLGGNGAGKSTLLQLIMSEISPYADDEKGVGTIERFDGMTMDMARSHIGVVSPAFQTAYGRELAWEPTALETVLSGYRGSVGMLDEPTAEELLGAQEWLGLVGLGDLSDRPLRRMSYGQQRRVLLARAMAPGPSLLLLDEPLGGLDPASRGLMVMLLQQLAEGGTPMVLVTHHGEDRIPAINMVMELEKGRQIFCGTREEYERATSEKEV